MRKLPSVINPFVSCSHEEIAKKVVYLMPEVPEMTPQEREKFDRELAEDQARYREARFGELPKDCWRILENGSIEGLTHSLEIDSQEILLNPQRDGRRVYGISRQQATDLALEIIAQRRDQATADAASFRFVWGGRL